MEVGDEGFGDVLVFFVEAAYGHHGYLAGALVFSWRGPVEEERDGAVVAQVAEAGDCGVADDVVGRVGVGGGY